jgi:hypothetical protein
MTYRKPEVGVLGDALLVIEGMKPHTVETDGHTTPGVNIDALGD